MKIRKLHNQISAMGQTVAKLKKDREVSQREVEKLQGTVNNSIQAIKVRLTWEIISHQYKLISFQNTYYVLQSTSYLMIQGNPKISESEIEKLYQDILGKCDALIKALTKRVEAEKNAEEQARARKIQEEMERQKREKEEAERERMVDEENRKR